MSKRLTQLLVLAVCLLLAQVVCNKILLFNVATPMVFIYLLLRLPVTWSVKVVLTVGFCCGLGVDIFNNTPGMHALASTLLAGSRLSVLHAYLPREDDMTDPMPSRLSMGLWVYFKYMSTLALLYCTVVFLVQAFTLHDFVLTLLRIAASWLLTVVLIMGIDSLVSTHHEKRL